MNLRSFGLAGVATAAAFFALAGVQSASAACKDDLAAVLPIVEKEQNPDTKEKAKQELQAAQVSAGAQDEVTCKHHVNRAKEHLKIK
jgi:hypothetical protein